MNRLHFTIVKNAVANVIKGGAAAIVALALPHFLTQRLDHDRFAAWALMLQLAAYANYFDFGLQTAVARYMAYYIERKESERCSSLLGSALALLTAAGAIAALLTGVLVLKLPAIFHGIPPSLVPELRNALLLLGVSTALMLPLSAFSAALVGLHRNEFVAVTVGGSRILGALGVLAAAQHTESLVMLSLCISAANLLGGIAQIFILKNLLPNVNLFRSRSAGEMISELTNYCAGLTVWSFSMFLVTGLDLTIVGHFNFAAVGYYSLAASMISFFSGMNGAVCSALMTPVAALHASRDIELIQKLTLSATRLNTFVNLIATSVVLLAGRWFLRIWVGDSYGGPALPIVEVLMVANAVRLVANPYSFMLIATDQQKYGIAQGAVEGLSNVVASILGALWLGPIGVALGTVIGAVCGIAWTTGLTMRWVREVPLKRRDFVQEGLFKPFLCTLPLLTFGVIMRHRFFGGESAFMLAACVGLTYLLANRFGSVLPTSLHVRKFFAQAT